MSERKKAYHVKPLMRRAIEDFILKNSFPSPHAIGYTQWNDPLMTHDDVARRYKPEDGSEGPNSDHIASIAKGLGIKFTQLGSKKKAYKPRLSSSVSIRDNLRQRVVLLESEIATTRREVTDVTDFLTRSWPTWREFIR